MPWPLHNMNVVVEAVGTDLLDTAGGFLITFYTPKDYKVRERAHTHTHTHTHIRTQSTAPGAVEVQTRQLSHVPAQVRFA